MNNAGELNIEGTFVIFVSSTHDGFPIYIAKMETRKR